MSTNAAAISRRTSEGRLQAHGIARDARASPSRRRKRPFPGDRDVLFALVQLSLAAGDPAAAARWTQALDALDRRAQ
jgi:hypothetical protein